jgi:hypothetical protein
MQTGRYARYSSAVKTPCTVYIENPRKVLISTVQDTSYFDDGTGLQTAISKIGYVFDAVESERLQAHI